MIFVTLGTHEKPMMRLMDKLDSLVESGVITDEVYITTGLGSPKPKHCRSVELLPYDELEEAIASADLVITHGGPGSIMMALAQGKPLIAVPRLSAHGEHVDDHQVQFVKKMEEEGKLMAVYDINELAGVINGDSIKRLQRIEGEASKKLTKLIDRLHLYCRAIR